MAVMRVEKNRNYTTMSNYHLRDTSLSLKAIGLLSKILSLPEDWDYTVAGLAAICKEGRDAIQSAIKELEAAGYIERRQTHAEDGSFSSNEYVVHEVPAESPLTGFPSTVKPSTGNPLTENPPQLSTDISSKDLNNPPIAPRGGEAEDFDRFWQAYPKKVGKQAARKAFHRVKTPVESLLRAISEQKRSDQWSRDGGRFVPNPATWLNQGRWEDELPTVQQPRGQPQHRREEADPWK